MVGPGSKAEGYFNQKITKLYVQKGSCAQSCKMVTKSPRNGY